MRKVISVFLCVVLLFGILPLYATASEGTDVQEELINLACEVFPEYADILQNPPTAMYNRIQSNESDTIVFTGTRNVSENHLVSIVVFQSGSAYVVDKCGFEYEETEAHGSQIGPDYIGGASFKVTCTTLNGVFLLNDVEYIVHQNGTGYFTSYGTYETDEYERCKVGTITKESSFMSYDMTFGMDSAGSLRRSTTFELYFDGSLIAKTKC